MSKKGKRILEWTSTTGARKAIIIVTDKSVPESDVNHQKIEVSRYDSDTSKWTTETEIDHVEELESFGIPEDFVN